ncbi:MAG: (d)CMP kinase [Azospirillaceae bacterium]|nr:(d)CMP kinase [Azospirillaceae bacterium]
MGSARPRARVIAIDGPAASGKGTLAARIADHLGFAHLDTGSLYRAVGLIVLRNGDSATDRPAAITAARSLCPERAPAVLRDSEIRSDRVGQAASTVAAIPEVRAALLGFQREFAADPPGAAAGAVLDGRDVGTVICPDADAKLFVTASVEVRAQRRLKELQARGVNAIDSHVLADMKDRDRRDSERATAPLVKAADAFVLDTSDMTADQAFEAALGFIRSRIGPDAA